MAERYQRNANDEASSPTLPGRRNVQSNTFELPTITTQPSQGDVELHTLSRTPSHESLASISSDEIRILPSRQSVRSVTQASLEPKSPFRRLKKFWCTHVVLTVSQRQTLDHGALERTFLAYIRTSLAFSFLGVLVAQILTLQVKLNPEAKAKFGFHNVGIPLSCVCHGFAMLIPIMGAYRFWRQQSALTRGKVYTGGWELNVVGVFTGGVASAMFVLVIVVGALTSKDGTY